MSATDGTRQSDRFPAALAAPGFQADELRLPELLSMSAGFADCIRFADLNGQLSETWAGIFDADEALLIAGILSFDRSAQSAYLLEDFEATPSRQLVEELAVLTRQFELWRAKLEAIDQPAARAVRTFMSDMTNGHLRQELQSAWPLIHALPEQPAASGAAKAGRFPVLSIAERERVRGQLAAIGNAIARVQDVARNQFEMSLQNRAHDPAAAMLLAFMQLYRSVQARFNRFTQRHVEFYYGDCLLARRRPAIADRAFLVLARDPRFRADVLVTKGTLFSADKDDSGREAEFAALRDLTVQAVKVAALRTLRLERDPLISPEYELGFVTRAIGERLPAQPAQSPPGVPPHWPLFGGGSAHNDWQNEQSARFGLAFASPQLFLKEGRREIRITLRFEDLMETDATVLHFVAEHAAIVEQPLAWLNARLTTFYRQLLALHSSWQPGRAAEASASRLAGQTLAALEVQPPSKDRVDWRPLLLGALRSNFPQAGLQRTDLDEGLGKLADELPVWPQVLAADAALASLVARYFALDPKLRDVAPELPDTAVQYFAKGTAERFPGNMPRTAAGYYHRFLLALVVSARTETSFRARLGKLFRNWLLDEQDWLTQDDIREIKTHYAQWAPQLCGGKPALAELDDGNPLGILYDLRLPDQTLREIFPDRNLIFDRLISRLFEVNVTTAEGWLAVPEAFAVRPESAPGSRPERAGRHAKPARGMTLVVPLHPKAPPLTGCVAEVHGSQWDTVHPVLRMQLSPMSRLFGYSLLGSALLGEVQIAVSASDIRDLVLHNNLGRVDPSKPFNPFGPLPDQASYLVLGSAEIAQKNLTELKVHLRWGGLPQQSGGFASHYRGYSQAVQNQSFAVDSALLRDGQWKALGGDSFRQNLFATEGDANKIAAGNTLRIDEAVLGGLFQATTSAMPGAPLVYDLNARDGFFKFQLREPPGAFGHAEYPALLTSILSANARRKVPLALPNAPYTPLLEGITVDYSAASHMLPGRNGGARDGRAEKIYHLHPFGMREIHPVSARDIPTVLPLVRHDGNLCIGLEGGQAGAEIALLFHLRDEEAATFKRSQSAVKWYYLAGNEWRALTQDRVLEDGTSGFLTSGIVRIVLPADIDREHSVLDDGLLWLCVCADSDFDCFADLYGVHANAIEVARVLPADAQAVQAALPAGSIKAMVSSLPGVVEIAQVGPSFGMRHAETMVQMYTRVGERLRHKNRAVSPWDYERLVLEAFPQVFKAKCFSNLQSPLLGDGDSIGNGSRDGDIAVTPPAGRTAPGHVLMVVLPARTADDRLAPPPLLNAVELARVRHMLAKLASGCAHVEVRNVCYERIQVRCRVELVAEAQAGQALRTIDAALQEYLSPWHPGGYEARFDWAIRHEDVETVIRALDCVKNVSGLSLLRISEDDFGAYALADTARPATAQINVGARRIGPNFPWSIAVPMDWHLIEIEGGTRETGTTAGMTVPAAQPTGIGALAVGSNYIVGGADG